MRSSRLVLVCCFLTIAALLVAGSVSHGVIRHIVQTAPLWIAIVLAFRESDWSTWAAIPCFLFWLLIMVAIWLYILGWARIITGTFSLTETAMTIIVGMASATGLFAALSRKTAVAWWRGIAVMVVVALLQLIALRVSLLPAIAHR